MKGLGASFDSAKRQTSGTVSPSLFEPYNLNHVSVFSVALALSVLLALGQPSLTYPSRHPLAARVLVLAYQLSTQL
jgi:hypothetical protein